MERRNQKGFTLAETLITLVIVGVVAALTVPTMMNRTNKQELDVAFKKQYSLLSQAVLGVKNTNYLEFNASDYGHDNKSFSKTLAKQYRVLHDCGSINSNTGCVLQNSDATFSHYKTLNGKAIDRGFFDDAGFVTADGTTFLIEEGSQSTSTGFLVSVDINGHRKGPNKMGYDLFMFSITPNGTVLPMGYLGTYWYNLRNDLCSYTSTSSQNGYTCAYFAATNKEYFKNLH